MTPEERSYDRWRTAVDIDEKFEEQERENRAQRFAKGQPDPTPDECDYAADRWFGDA